MAGVCSIAFRCSLIRSFGPRTFDEIEKVTPVATDFENEVSERQFVRCSRKTPRSTVTVSICSETSQSETHFERVGHGGYDADAHSLPAVALPENQQARQGCS